VGERASTPPTYSVSPSCSGATTYTACLIFARSFAAGKELTEVEKDGKDYEIWKLQNPLHYAATVRGPDLASAIEANRDQLNAVDDVSKCSTGATH
jgi:hypothetical protein